MMTRPHLLIIDLQGTDRHPDYTHIVSILSDNLSFWRQHMDVSWVFLNPTTQEREGTTPLIAPHDKVFIKPDIDSGLETACDQQGHACLDYFKTLSPPDMIVCGITFYGCVLGACYSLQEIGYHPMIARHLTDEDFLPQADHEEGLPYLLRSKIRLLDQYGFAAQIQTYVCSSNKPAP